MAEQPTMREALTRALQEIERLRGRETKRRAEPIAIVSMACRWPGAVDSPEALWALLQGGTDAITEVPPYRWAVGDLFDPDPEATGKTYSRWGGFLGPVDAFDAGFFGISPREAKSIDPQERLLLETAWEVLERAGIVPEKLVGSATGVYVGICGAEYLTLGGMDPGALDAYSLLGTAHSAIVGRLSYVLGLEGPNFPVDTACSSSLVALHLACQGLRAGECDLALAGGVNLLLSPLGHVYLSRLKAMSPTGRCHTFSDQADGYVRAEGCGMVLLKRLSDAERDGDEILALVRGSAVNQDGQSNGFTAPSGPAQQAVIRRALEMARIPPATIDYLECHGTGTPLGDPIEVQALAAVLGEGRSPDAPIVLGSIKSNIGHTEGAAGIAGVMKAVLALRHRRIPRTVHAEHLNPHIDWRALPVRVASEGLDWPDRGGPRRAGVSSFGFSGTNAHVVLEEAPARPLESAPSELGPLLISARDPAALSAQAARWASWVQGHPEADWSTVLRTAAETRSWFSARAAISAPTPRAALDPLLALANGEPHPDLVVGSGSGAGKLALLFTGQGAQRSGMGRDLYARDPVFRNALDEVCNALSEAIAPAGGFTPPLTGPDALSEAIAPAGGLRDIMFADVGSPLAALLGQTAYAQPALFALEVALFRRWVAWGLRPDYLLGHSIGELSAACAAQVLSLEDAARLVVGRGRLMQACQGRGAMVSIDASEDEVIAALAPGVSVAAQNGPRQTVISGDEAAVLAVAERFAAQGRRTRRLAVSHAFHSAHMDAALTEFRALAERCSFSPPTIPIVSNLSGRLVAAAELSSPDYWTRQLRETVRFLDGVRVLETEGVRTYLECGPSAVLCALAAGAVSDPAARFIPSLGEPGEDLSLAQRQVFVEGHAPRGAFAQAGRAPVAPLPTYAFQRERYWIDAPPAMLAGDLASERYALAGSRLYLPSGGVLHLVEIGPGAQAYLGDHLVYGHIVVPAAFFVGVLLAVGESSFPGRPIAIEGVQLLQALSFKSAQERTPLFVQLIPDADGFRATLGTRRDGSFVEHASARLRPAGAHEISPGRNLAEWQAELPPPEDASPVIEGLARRSIQLLPRWRRLAAFSSAGTRALGQLNALQHADAPVDGSAFDALFGLLSATFDDAERSAAPEAEEVPYLPFMLERLIWTGATGPGRWVAQERALSSRLSDAQIRSSARLWDESGELMCQLEGFVAYRAPKERLLKAIYGPGDDLERLRYRLSWIPAEPGGEPALPGRTGLFLVGGPSPLGDQVQDSLRTGGATIELLGSLEQAVSSGLDRVLVQWPEGEGEVLAAAHQLSRSALDLLQRWPSSGAPPMVWLLPEGLSLSPLWGLARSARTESPDLALRLVELRNGDLSALPLAVMRIDEAECAVSEGGLELRRLLRAGTLPPLRKPLLRTDGPVWITGGLSGIGAEIAKWLVTEQGVQQLVLIGRRGPETPGAEALVAELAARGAEAWVVAADVGDRAALADLLTSMTARWPGRPLRGVFHAAGVLDDGIIDGLSPQRLSQVLRPKVDGAANLDAITEGLDVFVLISSVAGSLGAPGQSSYAAANTFLDALSLARQARGQPSLALQYGPWAEHGMASRLELKDRTRQQRQGLDALSTKQALGLLAAALSDEREAVSFAAALDTRALERALEQSGAAVPSVYRRLIHSTGAAKAKASALRTRLSELPETQREKALLEVVRREIAEVLGVPSGKDIKPAVALQELGLDSLMAVDLRNRLAALAGVALSATVVFDHPSPQAVTQFLLEEMKLKAAKAKPAPLSAPSSEDPIAVVSLACRFPGGVTTPEAFWELLDSGRDAITEVPRQRWDIDEHFDADPDAGGKTYSRWGGFVGDIERFDASFFGISPREARSIDPQQRLLLETSWEAFERAGYTQERLRNSDTGVYVGICGTEYQVTAMADVDGIDAYSLIGTAHSGIVGRISYWLGLEGPNFPVDTACSSSLVALHLACQALRQQECSMALVAGVNLILSPHSHIYFSRLKAMSPTGRSRAFSADADGYVRGEGCGVVVLKRLSEAQRDGDQVLALVRGTAVGQDGPSNGFTAPSGPAQQTVIRRALSLGRCAPSSIGYVECHGTGTSLGDPIEVQALAAVLGEGRDPARPVLLGSVKTNIGHGEGAAGIASLIKTVLALQHGRLPKTLHANQLSPHIPWDQLPVSVVRESTDWITDGAPRRAGVSSFGFSGTNAHAVLEEAPRRAPTPRVVKPPRALPLLLSARSTSALAEQAQRWAEWLSLHPEADWSDVVSTAAIARTHFEVRGAVIASSGAEAASRLAQMAVLGARSVAGGAKLAVLFTGQGSPWAGMGRELWAEDLVFRQELDAVCAALDPILGSPLQDRMFSQEEGRLEQTEWAQPALFALEIALFRRWQRLGLEPELLLGHSIGELSAAHVAGVLSLEDAARLVIARAQAMQACRADGAMVALEATEDEVLEALVLSPGAVDIAAQNGPTQTVISGDAASVLRLAARFTDQGRRVQRLKVSHAFHSAHMDAALAQVLSVAEQLELRAPQIPIISNLSGRVVTEVEIRSPQYWVDQLRGTVRFLDGMRSLEAAGARTFLECGPGGVLSAMGAGCVSESAQFIVSLRQGQERASQLEAASALYARDHALDWGQLLEPPAQRGGAALPTYAFQRERYFVDAPEILERRARSGGARGRHALAGERLALPGEDAHYVLNVSTQHQPYLAEHVIHGLTIVPAAFYLSVLLAVAAERFEAEAASLEDVLFLRPILLSGPVRLHVVLRNAEGAQGVRFSIQSQGEDGAWLNHVEGLLRPGAEPREILATSAAHVADCPQNVSAERSLELLDHRRAALGPQFRWIGSARTGPGKAHLELVPPAPLSPAGSPVHTGLLDQGFAGGFTLAMVGDQDDEALDHAPWLPFSIKALRFQPSGLDPSGCGVDIRSGPSADSDTSTADIAYWDSAGQVVLEIEGYTNKRVPGPSALQLNRPKGAALRFELGWESAEAPPRGALLGKRYQLWSNAPQSASSLVVVAELEGAGATVERVAALTDAPGLDGLISVWGPGPDPILAAHQLAAAALAQLQASPRAPLVWITEAAVQASPGEALEGLGASVLWGLARAARQERPELSLRLIDGASGIDRALSLASEPECALRGADVLVPRLRAAPPRTAAPFSLQPGASVLVTGGLGALGRRLAAWLVTELDVERLILCSRRGAETEGAALTVAELEQLGAEVRVVAADVADRSQLASIFDEEPNLRGVVHAAGLLDDGVIASLSPEQVSRVLRPKVDGAYHLHELSLKQPLELFVLISSIAGVLGAPGQTNYAAANSFLDALAGHRRALGLTAMSLGFGPWASSGVSGDLAAADLVRMERRGVGVLSPEDALGALGAVLSERVPSSLAVALDLKRIERALERSLAPVPALFRRLIQPRSPTGGSANAFRRRLVALAEGERSGALADAIRDEVRQVMGLSAGQELDPAQPLSEAGLDSLMAVELRNRLMGLTELTLPATLVFDHPSPGALSRFLLEKMNLERSVAAPLRRRAATGLDEPIAVISMACRFPGGVETPADLWRLLDEGQDAVTVVPSSRWAVEPLFDADPEAAGKTYSRWGSFLGDVDRFDPAFFGIGAAEAVSIDPQQRLLLETGWEAFERAGYTLERLNGSNTGVYVGICGMEYLADALSDYAAVDAYSYLGVAHSSVVGRLSYWLGLEGPNFPVDTACSSSLVTLHLACQALRNQECDMALAGGVNLILAPWGHIYFSRLKALSPTGRCRTFSSDADGYVRAEGCGMILLKRLSDARRDGDEIVALIRGSAVNQDGRSNGFTAPSGPAQEAVIRRALSVAQLPASSVDAVECHGTGTPLGDPIEVQALAAVYGVDRGTNDPVVIGSLKSNIGHAEGAAGIGGALKAILSLQHRRHPKLLHFSAPSSNIPWETLNVRVPTEGLPWPRRSTPRRAGVSSFGFSGTNAHVIFEEAPEAAPPQLASSAPHLPLLLSAQSRAALSAQATRWASFLAAHPETRWVDVLRTAAVDRTHFDVRATIRGESPVRALDALRALASDQPHAELTQGQRRSRGKIVFVFPGQGSQWATMGAELLRDSGAFRQAVDACDAALKPWVSYSVLSVLRGDSEGPSLERVEVVQPALFAMSIGLVAAWRALGLNPAAVVGHSQGEIAAAVVAGALSLAEGAKIVALRSQLLSRVKHRGGMAVLALSVSEASERIARFGGALSVAVVNTPRSTVVAGDITAIDALIAEVEASGVYAKKVNVDYASHSAHVDEVVAELEGLIATLRPREAEIPFYSTVSGARASGTELDGGYWCRNLRQPVRFDRALEHLVADGHGVFVEISAHPVLGMALAEAGGERAVVTGTLNRERGALGELYATLGVLHAQGVAVDWQALHAPGGGRRVELPTYAFQQKRYWRAPHRPAIAERAAPLWQEAWKLDSLAADSQLRGRWLLIAEPTETSRAIQASLEASGAEVSRAAPCLDRVSLATALGGLQLEGVVAVASRGFDFEQPPPGLPPALLETLTLVQALGDAGQKAPLWLLTEAAESVNGEPVQHPEQRMISALGRVVGLEHSDRFGGLIDLPSELGQTELRLLRVALTERRGPTQVALRSAGRYLRRLSVAHVAETPPLSRVRGTALITGGTGGIASHLARWLVTERGAKRLVLVSRRGEAAPGAGRLSAELQALGAEVLLLAGDVGDVGALRLAVELASARAELPLSEVYHLAGSLDDGLLGALTEARLEKVLRPKLTGALHLHRLTESLTLDAFVLFSSLVGIVGSPGQGNYAAANAGLDALVIHRRQRGLRAASVAFGPWAEGGMVDAAVEARLRQIGLAPMAPPTALRGLARALHSGLPSAIVADVDWERFRSGLLDGFSRAPLSGAGLPENTLRASLLEAPASERLRRLSELVAGEVAAVLAIDDPSALDVGKGFRELGLDSLSAVALKGRLEQRTGVPVPVTLVFDRPTVDEAAAWLLEQLVPELSAPRAPEVIPAAAAEEAIAIVGVGLRLPGGATDLESLWEVLSQGRETVRPIPHDRFDMSPWYDPDPSASGKSYVRQAALLDDVRGFDAAFFGISPKEAAPMDPQHRLLLEASWSALEHAGLPPASLRGTATGVFAGVGANEYERSRARTIDEADAYYVTGSHTSFAAGRIAYHLGLQGPALTVDTACSSSLVALHLACNALRRGECDVALAAGAQVLASPMAFVMLSKTQALAPDGRSKTFSENADGYGRGEGVGVLVLQRLRDVKPGEGRVLGLVRGTAVNHDGASSGITAPNGTAQQRVLRAALRDAGLNASAVDVVECHGTGTKLGDPIEVVALSGVYGEGRSPGRPLQIGAAKTNLGHLEAAAGVVGVLKMLAAFRHQALPPTLHSSPANAHIPWSELALEVTTALTPWPAREDGQPRRAGVSAFGLSGTNAHVILEEPPPSAPLAGEAPLLFPLVLSAKSSEALEAEAGRWNAWLARNPAARASDVVYRAAAERTHFSERASILADSPAGWSTALSALAAGAALPPGCWRGTARGKLAVLFTGQGSQRAGMGRALYQRLPVFRRALDEIVRALEAHLESPLLPVLFADAGTAEAARLAETELAQPALFALEVALFRLWQSWGLRPDVLLGHSLGELVAAHVGSVLSLSDAARLVVARGRLMQRAQAGGAMVAIGAGWEEVSEELERWKSGARLGLAAHNGPRETVISGDASAVLSAAEVFAKRGHRTTRLAVSHAFHSAHMDGILEAFQAVAAQCRFEAPTIPIISNLSGRRASSAELCSPEYWARQLRGAVRFYDGVRLLHEQERVSTFLECGPQGVLSSMGANCLATDAATFVPSLRRDQDEPRQILGALSAVYAAGHDVDWAEVLSELPDPRPVDLPGYAFLRSPHWLETGTSIPRAPGGAHPLLGVGRRIPGADLRVHSSQISARAPSWIPDHVVMGQVLLPGAAFAELLLSAGAGSTEPVTLAQVLISAPLQVPSAGEVALEVTVEAAKEDGLRRVRVHSAGPSKLDDDPFRLHAEACLLAAADPAPSPVLTLPPPGSRELERSSAELYQALASHGLRYGPSFQALRRAWTSGDEVWGELELPAATAAEADRYGLHPALLDAATHAIAVAAQAAGVAPADVYLPLGMERLTRWRSGERRLWVRVKLGQRSPEVLRATLSLFASDGAPVAEIQGLELRRADRSSLLGLGETALDRLQFGVEWRVVELEQSAPRTRFGFLSQGPVAAWVDALQASLASLGVERVRSVEEVVERGLGGLVVAWPSSAETIREAHRIAAEGLAQLQRLGAVPGLRVVWVTQDAVRSRADDHLRGLAASVLWGLGRAARIEQASLSLTMLDVGVDPPSAAWWSAILQSSREPELSLRGGLLWSPRLVRTAPPAARQRRTGKEQTVLLTGAFGGLGRQVARWLVQERGVQHLLLTRRPGLASPAVASLTQELYALGAEVQVAPCDVTDREALAAVLRAIPPERPLRGIIHAAGVLDDGLLALLTPERLARVLSPKIEGAYNLHTLTAEEPLDFFVLFSSVAGLFGSAGQSNYSAANSFLDALASHRRAQGLAGQSIAWGPWSEGGMASALSEAHQARLLRQGLEPLSPSQGLSLLGAALDSEDELFVALDLDARRLARGLEQSRRAPPALLKALLPVAAIREDQAAALWARIRALAPAERPRALREVVQGEVATVLGLAQAQQVKPAEPLLELGIDSLSAVELRNRLATLVGVELSATLVFDYPTADALALLLLERSGLGAPPPSAGPAREDAITERIDALSDEEVGQELDALLGD